MVWDCISVLLITLLNKFLNTWGFFVSRLVICFHQWFDLYTNSYKLPNLFWVICHVSDIVSSVSQSVTCDSASLQIIFKLSLLEAEDSSQTLLVSLHHHIYFIFHPIHLKQIAAVQSPSYHLNWVGSSSFDPILFPIILFWIYKFV